MSGASVTRKYVAQYLRPTGISKPLLARVQPRSEDLGERVPKPGNALQNSIVYDRVLYLNQHLQVSPFNILVLTKYFQTAEFFLETMPVLANASTLSRYIEHSVIPFVHTDVNGQLVKSDRNTTLSRKMQYNSEMKILSFQEMAHLLGANVYRLPINDKYRPQGNPTYNVKSLLNFFEKMTENRINSSEYDELVRNKLFVSINCTKDYFDYQVELASAYQMYENTICYEHNACTRVQQFSLLLDHLKTNPSSAENVLDNALSINPYLVVPNFEQWTLLERKLYKQIFHTPNTNSQNTVGTIDSIMLCDTELDKLDLETRDSWHHTVDIGNEESYTRDTFALPETEHTIYNSGADEILDTYNRIRNTFDENRLNETSREPLKIAIIINRAHDQKQLQKLFATKNITNLTSKNKIELLFENRTNESLNFDTCVRTLAGLLDSVAQTEADGQAILNALIAFPEIKFEAISRVLKMSKDTGISLEEIMRYDSNFETFMKFVDHGKEVYKDHVRKCSKQSHPSRRNKIGYGSDGNNVLVDFLKDFMDDRGWNEESLTAKHIINIETFLKRVVMQKQALILSSESPLPYGDYAHKVKQRMNYKLDEFDPHETQVVNVYWLNDFLHNHYATAHFDHIFILGFAKKRGYPQNAFRGAFRAPSTFLRRLKKCPSTYIDVQDAESNMYDLLETTEMRSERISTAKRLQRLDFTNKILLNSKFQHVHTSNANYYDGMKTLQEPSPWLANATNGTMVDKASVSYISSIHLIDRDDSKPSYNSVKRSIDLFHYMFESPEKRDKDLYTIAPMEIHNNNGSTYAGDFLPLHDGGNIDQQLLRFGAQSQKHMSHSQLQTYKKCPKSYMYKYVLNVPEEPPTPLMVYGSAMHETIEYFWKLRGLDKDKICIYIIQNKIFISEDSILEKCINFFKTNWSRNCNARQPYFLDGQFKILEKQGIEGIVNFVGRYSTSPLPMDVEKEFRIPIPDYPAIDLVGAIDLIEYNGNIVEFKSNKLSNQAGINNVRRIANTSTQPQLYALTRKDKERVFVEGVENGERAEVTIKEGQDALGDVIQTLGEIHKGKFAAKPNHFACSFCSFKRLCTDHTLGEISTST